MNWEMQNNKPPAPPPAWSEWTPLQPGRYIGNWLLYVWLIPYLLGVVLTPGGIFLTTLLIDYFQYIKARNLGEY